MQGNRRNKKLSQYPGKLYDNDVILCSTYGKPGTGTNLPQQKRNVLIFCIKSDRA